MSNYKVNPIVGSSLNPDSKSGLPPYAGNKKNKQTPVPTDTFVQSEPIDNSFIEQQKAYLEAAKKQIIQRIGDSIMDDDIKTK